MTNLNVLVITNFTKILLITNYVKIVSTNLLLLFLQHTAALKNAKHKLYLIIIVT